MDIKNIVDSISKLSPIIVLVLATIIKAVQNIFVRSINIRKLNYIKDRLPLLGQFDEDFEHKFIRKDLKERYFYLQTEIYTNAKSIDSYINFKNKLGGNYNWKQIKLAKDFLRNKDNNITVNVTIIHKIVETVTIVMALLLFVVGFSILSYLLITNKIKNIHDFTMLVFPAFSIIGGLYLLYIISPFIMATSMHKRLNRDKTISH